MKKQNKPQIVRQGDVLLVPIKEIPAQAKSIAAQNSRVILAKGEATGHHHSIDSREADLLQVPSQSEIYLLVKEGDALLEHQEHGKIGLAKGSYRVIIQREYDPSGERKVQD